MFGIISDLSFNNMFRVTKDDNVMQATVTAVYEVGMYWSFNYTQKSCIMANYGRLSSWCFLCFDVVTGWVVAGWSSAVQRSWLLVSSFKWPRWRVTSSFSSSSLVMSSLVLEMAWTLPQSLPIRQSAHTPKTEVSWFVLRVVLFIGTMVSYWIDFGAHYGPQDLVWRFPIAFQDVFGIFIIIGMYYLPESPRWLIAHDWVCEGEHVLAALSGVEVDDHQTQMEKTLVMESVIDFISYTFHASLSHKSSLSSFTFLLSWLSFDLHGCWGTSGISPRSWLSWAILSRDELFLHCNLIWHE